LVDMGNRISVRGGDDAGAGPALMSAILAVIWRGDWWIGGR